MNKLVKYLKYPKLIPLGLIGKIFGCNWMSDKMYLEKQFYIYTNKKLNLKNPITFNEKMQWLKLYNRNPNYTKMVDKYEVKEYVENLIGNEYIIPTIGIYDSWDEIDFSKLPNQFVIKCTHNSGGVIICNDKNNFDYENSKKIINKYLNRNYYYISREWPYKNVKPRIIIEKYMTDEFNEELKDYKIFCFNGVPRLIQVDYGRFTNHRRRFFDVTWNILDFSLIYKDDKKVKIKKPIKLKEMLDLSKKISKNMPFVRCDFYEVNNKVYFGEITFYPEAGIGRFEPEIWDTKLGEMLKIPNLK